MSLDELTREQVDLEALRQDPENLNEIGLSWGHPIWEATLPGILTAALGNSNSLKFVAREALQQTAVDLALLSNWMECESELNPDIVQAFVRGVQERARAAAALAYKIEQLNDEELKEARASAKPVTPIPNQAEVSP